MFTSLPFPSPPWSTPPSSSLYMDFNSMIQNTTHLEEYALPVSVLFVFLLLIHQRHRFTPATATEDERLGRGVRPSGRIQRAASVAAAAAVAAAEMDELDADDTAGSFDSDGVLECPPSPSDSLSSNAEAGYSNGEATRANSLCLVPEQRAEDSRSGGIYRSLSESEARAGLSRTSTEGSRSLLPGSRFTTATSTAVQGLRAASYNGSQVSRVGSSAVRTSLGALSRDRRDSSAGAELASSVSVAVSLPKVEENADGYVLNQPVPISTPLPPKRASTPRTPSKARSGRAFTPDFDNAPSSDPTPLSSPLPPKQVSTSSRGPSASRGLSSASTGIRASAAARSRTGTPSSASTLRASRTSQATPPPSSAGSSASAAHSRACSETPDLWTPLSRMSSLSPTPSEVVERWIRHVSSRTLPSTDDVKEEGGRVVVTTWFESFSTSGELIDSPPDLQDHPDLQHGDLFYHSTANDYQLWIWEVNDHGMLCWVPVKFMSVRNGMYLTLTPGEHRPSWVGEKYALLRKKQLLRLGYKV